MKKISLTILALLITTTLMAKKAPGITKADGKEERLSSSYIGVSLMEGATGTDKLTKAGDETENQYSLCE